jgi:transmembrane sensor
MGLRNETEWDDPAHEAAAEWVVRLHGSVSDAQAEADWLAFESWLDAGEGNRAAYDAAEALWSDIGRQNRAVRKGLFESEGATILTLPVRRGNSVPVWWAACAAAAASVLLVVGPFSPFGVSSAPAVYATAKGERRSLTLADGSRITLNSGSRLSVLIDAKHRQADLAEGSEAAFTIVHDANRPFVVRVGDRTVRDLGTEFDVLRSAGDLKVTVRSGLVEVAPAAGAAGETIALSPGRQLDHREGAAKSLVTTTVADDAFGWRSGRLIYRDRPISEVVVDLDRYFTHPVRVEGAASNMRFSGVLALGSELEMIDRLSALVPLSANSKDGVIVLQERAIAR